MKSITIVTCILIMGAVLLQAGPDKRPTCATVKDAKGEVVLTIQGLPPFVWGKDGRLLNQQAVEKAMARAIWHDPGISQKLKDTVISPATRRALQAEAELERPMWRDINTTPGNDPTGGGVCCPCLGQVCQCFGTMIGGPVITCGQVTLDCREVSPGCKL